LYDISISYNFFADEKVPISCVLSCLFTFGLIEKVLLSH